jgi:molecular chaperone GrpE (heat shock protein)
MTGIDMNKFIVSLALMYCFSFNTYAISPEEKARKIIAEEKAYVIKEKAKANAIARRMNREREEVKIWGNAKEIEKHLRATYDFQDFLRYEAQLS